MRNGPQEKNPKQNAVKQAKIAASATATATKIPRDPTLRSETLATLTPFGKMGPDGSLRPVTPTEHAEMTPVISVSTDSDAQTAEDAVKTSPSSPSVAAVAVAADPTAMGSVGIACGVAKISFIDTENVSDASIFSSIHSECASNYSCGDPTVCTTRRRTPSNSTAHQEMKSGLSSSENGSQDRRNDMRSGKHRYSRAGSNNTYRNKRCFQGRGSRSASHHRRNHFDDYGARRFDQEYGRHNMSLPEYCTRFNNPHEDYNYGCYYQDQPPRQPLVRGRSYHGPYRSFPDIQVADDRLPPFHKPENCTVGDRTNFYHRVRGRDRLYSMDSAKLLDSSRPWSPVTSDQPLPAPAHCRPFLGDAPYESREMNFRFGQIPREPMNLMADTHGRNCKGSMDGYRQDRYDHYQNQINRIKQYPTRLPQRGFERKMDEYSPRNNDKYNAQRREEGRLPLYPNNGELNHPNYGNGLGEQMSPSSQSQSTQRRFYDRNGTLQAPRSRLQGSSQFIYSREDCEPHPEPIASEHEKTAENTNCHPSQWRGDQPCIADSALHRGRSSSISERQVGESSEYRWPPLSAPSQLPTRHQPHTSRGFFSEGDSPKPKEHHSSGQIQPRPVSTSTGQELERHSNPKFVSVDQYLNKECPTAGDLDCDRLSIRQSLKDHEQEEFSKRLGYEIEEEMIRAKSFSIPVTFEGKSSSGKDLKLNPQAAAFRPTLKDQHGNTYLMTAEKGTTYFRPKDHSASCDPKYVVDATSEHTVERDLNNNVLRKEDEEGCCQNVVDYPGYGAQREEPCAPYHKSFHGYASPQTGTVSGIATAEQHTPYVQYLPGGFKSAQCYGANVDANTNLSANSCLLPSHDMQMTPPALVAIQSVQGGEYQVPIQTDANSKSQGPFLAISTPFPQVGSAANNSYAGHLESKQQEASFITPETHVNYANQYTPVYVNSPVPGTLSPYTPVIMAPHSGHMIGSYTPNTYSHFMFPTPKSVNVPLTNCGPQYGHLRVPVNPSVQQPPKELMQLPSKGPDSVNTVLVPPVLNLQTYCVTIQPDENDNYLKNNVLLDDLSIPNKTNSKSWFNNKLIDRVDNAILEVRESLKSTKGRKKETQDDAWKTILLKLTKLPAGFAEPKDDDKDEIKKMKKVVEILQTFMKGVKDNSAVNLTDADIVRETLEFSLPIINKLSWSVESEHRTTSHQGHLIENLHEVENSESLQVSKMTKAGLSPSRAEQIVAARACLLKALLELSVATSSSSTVPISLEKNFNEATQVVGEWKENYYCSVEEIETVKPNPTDQNDARVSENGSSSEQTGDQGIDVIEGNTGETQLATPIVSKSPTNPSSSSVASHVPDSTFVTANLDTKIEMKSHARLKSEHASLPQRRSSFGAVSVEKTISYFETGGISSGKDNNLKNSKDKRDK